MDERSRLELLLTDHVESDSGPGVIIHSDRNGNPVAFNKTAQHYFEVKPPLSWQQIVCSRDLVHWETNLKTSVANEQPFSGWFRFRRHDNAVKSFLVQAKPQYSDDGNVIGHLITGLEAPKGGHEVDSEDSHPSSVVQLAEQWRKHVVSEATVITVSTELLEQFLGDLGNPEVVQALDHLKRSADRILEHADRLNQIARQRPYDSSN